MDTIQGKTKTSPNAEGEIKEYMAHYPENLIGGNRF